jgi:plastocyanin
MRTATILAVAGTLLAVLATAAVAATTRVKIGDNYFVHKGGRPTVTVNRGDRVTWVWTGKNIHNVTVRSGPVRFGSRTQSKGTYTRRMRRAGTYVIYCTVHGYPTQTMTLVVR